MKQRQEQPWKNVMDVTVSLDHFKFTQELVEKLAYRPYLDDAPFEIPEGEPLALAAIEAYMKGYFHMTCGEDAIKMPFISSFFFTCTRLLSHHNKLTWSHSLS